MRRISLLAVAALLFSACTQPRNTEPVVTIGSGTIEGVYEQEVFAFKGVPYAQSERFQASQPVEAWEGVRECKEYGPWAKQAENEGKSAEFIGDFLANVWTAGLNDGAKRPIMFWIHGGGFSFGSANADPTDGVHLAQKGMVVVSINHRLDVLGFLDLSEFGEKWQATVNAGMYDIINALKWTRDNAEAFGGDPDNITVFGESGGGGKVGTLLCMPEAKGLFQKAIIQSGAYHSLDIPLCFDNPYDERYQVKDGDPKAQLVSDRMSNLWMSFARNGKPVSEGVPEWEPYTKDNGATLIIDNEYEMKYNFDRKLEDILYGKLK